MSIGQRIKKMRGVAGISQKDLAARIEVSRGNVGEWELDKVKPGADALLGLSRFFKVSVDYILSGEESQFAQILEQSTLNTVQLASGQGVSQNDLELLAKFHQLSEGEQLKVEGIIEGILMTHVDTHSVKQPKSSHSTSTEREESATKSESA